MLFSYILCNPYTKLWWYLILNCKYIYLFPQSTNSRKFWSQKFFIQKIPKFEVRRTLVSGKEKWLQHKTGRTKLGQHCSLFYLLLRTQTNNQKAFVLLQSLQPHFQTHIYAYYVIWSITRSYSNNCYQSLNLPYPIKRFWRENSGGATWVFPCHHLHIKIIQKALKSKNGCCS